MVVYGGRNSSDTLQTLGVPVALNLINIFWSPLGQGDSRPTPRFAQCGFALGSHRFVTIGGTTNGEDASRDVWVYDVLKSRWENLVTLAPLIIPERMFGRYAQACAPYSNSLLSMGGYYSARGGQDKTTDATIYGLTMGCNPGSLSPNFSSVSCAVCAKGSFAHYAGELTCTVCPGVTTTRDTGSITSTDCAVCQTRHCKGHGDCTINPTNLVASCICHTGYRGAQCDQNILVIALSASLGVSAVVFVALILWKYVRRRFMDFRFQDMLTTNLLAEQNLELAELHRAFEIEADDVIPLKRIDEGSEGAFGEVWMVLWNDKTVAMKRLKRARLHMDEDAVLDFEAEVRFLRSLRHRNVLFFYGPLNQCSYSSVCRFLCVFVCLCVCVYVCVCVFLYV